MNVDDVFILNTGDIGTGVYDFGGATSFEIPNANDPATAAAGQIALDTNGEALEFFGAASRYLPAIQICSKTIVDPDGIQTTEDAVPLLFVADDWAPFGITIKDIHLAADASNSGTYVLEEWTAPATWGSDIESVAFVAALTAEDDGTLADSAIATNTWVFVDMDTTALNWLMVTFTYYINPGN